VNLELVAADLEELYSFRNPRFLNPSKYLERIQHPGSSFSKANSLHSCNPTYNARFPTTRYGVVERFFSGKPKLMYHYGNGHKLISL